jgi:hypothetical protein
MKWSISDGVDTKEFTVDIGLETPKIVVANSLVGTSSNEELNDYCGKEFRIATVGEYDWNEGSLWNLADYKTNLSSGESLS